MVATPLPAVPRMLGGRLCLDFANTLPLWLRTRQDESLAAYGDLVAWSQYAGIANESAARRLLRTAAKRPAEAAAVLARTIALRAAIQRLVVAGMDGGRVNAADLAILNAVLSTAMARAMVTSVPHRHGFAWHWPEDDDLSRPLWPVARSAADLLTSADLRRVGQCPGCGWVFLDTSKNRSRRWCAMDICGNRAKARRHYARSKKDRR